MEEKKTLSEFYEELKKLTSFSASDFTAAMDTMSSFANQANKAFTTGRQRMVELMNTITESVPGVNRLGGEISDVSKIIEDVAEASRRNVIASSEEVEQLFAASKVLGQDARILSNSFLDIGVGIEEVGNQLDQSMNYVRSIGGNAKQVFTDVQRNMEQMNRYQFEGGVQGLTKMAAQASMLRFNMNETFKLADRVLDPEGAIETAAAFQRLGVAAGNLADPFQLMNQSINDPSGLQNSLADVAKQFTYFDEKTKTFKINPQGVLTLREMEKQTGVSAAEMSKMGLAAAELDKRLSEVSLAGLKFENEEDKQYLANIAKMGKGGKYEVELKDGTKKELQSLNQEEFDQLIKEQKEGPKTLEDYARAQMTATEVLRSDVSAIRNAILGGVVSAPQVTAGLEGARGIVESTTGGLSKAMTTEDVRKESQQFIKTLGDLAKDMADPSKSSKDTLIKFLESMGNQMADIEKKFGAGINKALTESTGKSAEKSGVEGKVGSYFNKLLTGSEGAKAAANQPLTTTVADKADKLKQETKPAYGETKTTDVNVNGKVTVDLNLPPGFADLNKEQQQKTLDAIFNSQQFQQMLKNAATPKNSTKAPISSSFGGAG